MRLVFCGTPEFAVPTLEAVRNAGHAVALVLTQPDRPSGRGMHLVGPPVKQAALKAGIAVEQPVKLRTNEVLQARLEAIAPDAVVVVAYGRIIPAWMLALPRYGNLNVHGSLLPKYRGAAPIQWAVARGESTTGVTTMRIDEGLDTGDMLLQRELAVAPDDTAADLYPRLAQMGAELLVETLAGLEASTIVPRPQDHSQSTLAPILRREDGRIDFSRTAKQIYDRWRGFQPWPGAWSMLLGKKFTVTRMALPPQPPDQPGLAPGSLLCEGAHLYAACGEADWIELIEVQVEGRRTMGAGDFLRGHALGQGARLG